MAQIQFADPDPAEAAITSINHKILILLFFQLFQRVKFNNKKTMINMKKRKWNRLKTN